MKKWFTTLIIFLLIALSGCYGGMLQYPIPDTIVDTEDVDPIDQVFFDYLGQTLPTDTAKRFLMSNANVTWFWNGPPVFSPDGLQVYWSKIFTSWDETEIWYKTKIDNVWSIERKLIIDGLDGFLSCPIFNGSSDELYFKYQSLQMDISIMKVTKINGEWQNPEMLNIPIPSEYTLDGRFSLADNNNIYFTLLAKSGLEHMKIYYAEYRNGKYSEPKIIEVVNGSTFGSGSPYIAKDESFILYDSGATSSYGVQDIYVSFKDESNHFMSPINLGDQINSIEEENSVVISEDGQYLFFSTKRTGDVFYTPYWIKLGEIEVFKTL